MVGHHGRKMKRFFVLTVGAVFVLLSTACQRKATGEIRIVVLADSDSAAYKLVVPEFVDFGAEEHRVSSGKRIALFEMYLPKSPFKDYMANQMNTQYLTPDLIVLDAPDQADLSPIAKQAAVNAKNACGAQGNCPVFITPWVSGEKLEAARIVFSSLTGNN
jgi:hypothetical protein